MQEEPKFVGDEPTKEEEEKLTWTSNQGKSNRSYEHDDHVVESPLKRKKILARVLIFQPISISTKIRLG
jgi:hypothetical protein